MSNPINIVFMPTASNLMIKAYDGFNRGVSIDTHVDHLDLVLSGSSLYDLVSAACEDITEAGICVVTSSGCEWYQDDTIFHDSALIPANVISWIKQQIQ